MTSRHGKNEGRDRVPWVGSALIHGAAFALLAWASMEAAPPTNFQTFQIEIVSAPATAPEPREETPPPEEELVVEQPEPTPPEPEDPPPVVDEEPPPPEVRDTPPEPEPDPTPVEEPAEETAADSADTEEETGEDIRVRMEGVERLYPRYYDNIIVQLRRCFRWQGAAGLEVQVYFVIDRDGTVSDDRVVRSSGNIRFDLRAIEAVVDCAGEGRFGPLPEDLPYDRLPVLFNFHPQR